MSDWLMFLVWLGLGLHGWLNGGLERSESEPVRDRVGVGFCRIRVGKNTPRIGIMGSRNDGLMPDALQATGQYTKKDFYVTNCCFLKMMY